MHIVCAQVGQGVKKEDVHIHQTISLVLMAK
jgi:hypothetical protein